MSKDLIPELSYEQIATYDPATLSILSDALENHGFFTVINHGIKDNLLDASYDLAKKFFDLDESIKAQAHSDLINGPIETYGNDIDVVVEAKHKELAVLNYGS